MNEALEKWCIARLTKYQRILLLDDHYLEFWYDREMDDGAMFCHKAMYPYKTTSITYGETAKRMWKAKRKRELELGLIHELCHSITWPLYDVAQQRYTTETMINNECERLTDHFANVIIKLLSVDGR